MCLNHLTLNSKLISTSDLITVFLAIFLVIGCKNKDPQISQDISIIPEPLELEVNDGYFKVNEKTQIIVNLEEKKVKEIAQYFVDQLNLASGYSLEISSSSRNNAAKNSAQLFSKWKWQDLVSFY